MVTERVRLYKCAAAIREHNSCPLLVPASPQPGSWMRDAGHKLSSSSKHISSVTRPSDLLAGGVTRLATCGLTVLCSNNIYINVLFVFAIFGESIIEKTMPHGNR